MEWSQLTRTQVKLVEDRWASRPKKRSGKEGIDQTAGS